MGRVLSHMWHRGGPALCAVRGVSRVVRRDGSAVCRECQASVQQQLQHECVFCAVRDAPLGLRTVVSPACVRAWYWWCLQHTHPMQGQLVVLECVLELLSWSLLMCCVRARMCRYWVTSGAWGPCSVNCTNAATGVEGVSTRPNPVCMESVPGSGAQGFQVHQSLPSRHRMRRLRVGSLV